jgi:hypothetical protein
MDTEEDSRPASNGNKQQFVSFRISSEDFTRIEEFARFLHSRGVIKAPTVPCLTRSILYTKLNKFAQYFEQAIERKRQEEAVMNFLCPHH